MGGVYNECKPPLRGVSVTDDTAEHFWKKFYEEREY